MSCIKFPLGQVVGTPGVLAAFSEAGDDPLAYLMRHITGDWGSVNAEDRQANEQSLVLGERLLSAYTMSNGTKFWIITEADHSSTCIVLPEEY